MLTILMHGRPMRPLYASRRKIGVVDKIDDISFGRA
jgi:hypothetical protein